MPNFIGASVAVVVDGGDCDCGCVTNSADSPTNDSPLPPKSAD